MSTTQEKTPLAERIKVEVGSESRRLFEKIMEQWRLIAGIAGIFIVLAAAYGGYSAYQKRKLTRAEQELSRIVLETSGPERLAALINLQGALPEALLPRYWLESAKAAQEQENLAKAMEFWKKLAEGGPDHWALLGQLGYGATLLRLGRPQEAVEELERLRARAPESMLPVVLLQLAEAAETAEDWERALAAYEQLKAMDGADQPGFLNFKAAEIRQHLEGDGS